MSIRNLTVKELAQGFSSIPALSHGDDFFIMDVNFRKGTRTRLAYPLRFGGLVTLYCIEGEFTLYIGMDKYLIKKNNYAVSLPGDIVSLTKNDDAAGKLRIMAISDTLLQDMEFDHAQAMITYRDRLILANRMYKTIIHRYRDIISAVLFLNHSESSKSLVMILRALLIDMAHMWEDLKQAPVSSDSRSNRMTEDFVSLVAQMHLEHRDLKFYANKLGITPKYLSAAVKKASGKSAVEWIASYVILEAKFFLKHTNVNIKQIAYDLNFENHADFYSYFRRHTGVSPTEFRKR